MVDIGFGTIDRRTVLVVLFTMVLGQLLFGLQIPVDTANIGRLFIDLVLLTGYLYLARSIYRLPFAMLFSLTFVSQDARAAIHIHAEQRKKSELDKSNIYIKRLRSISDWALFLIGNSLFVLARLFATTFSFGKWIEGLSPHYRDTAVGHVLAILDRIGLVLITIVATMPDFYLVVRGLGVLGLIVMTVVYVLRGDFTALMKDILEKKESEQDKQEPAVEIKNSRSEPLYVEVINPSCYLISTDNKVHIPSGKVDGAQTTTHRRVHGHPNCSSVLPV